MSRKIGALWLKETKEGKKYFSGVLKDLSGDIRISVFKNDKKEKENQPDYQIVLSEPAEKKSETSEELDAEDVPF